MVTVSLRQGSGEASSFVPLHQLQLGESRRYPDFIIAEEACRILNITPPTLYAYVTKGLLTSYRWRAERRSYYRRAEVKKLCSGFELKRQLRYHRESDSTGMAERPLLPTTGRGA